MNSNIPVKPNQKLKLITRQSMFQATWKAHLCFAILGRHVANTHALCGVTP